MGSTDESFSLTGYESKYYFLTETYVEFNQESMTKQRFTEQSFPEDVNYDDAAIGEMLSKAHREQGYDSQREGLSVGQSSSSISDRTGQLVVGEDLLPLSVQKTLNLCLFKVQFLIFINNGLPRSSMAFCHCIDCQAEIRKTRIPG